jgi:hypothetical protein
VTVRTVALSVDSSPGTQRRKQIAPSDPQLRSLGAGTFRLACFGIVRFSQIDQLRQGVHFVGLFVL